MTAAETVVETTVVEEVAVAGGAAAVVGASETVVVPEQSRPVIAVADELPSAGPTEAVPTQVQPAAVPARDGEIRISADHPMAALYMQTPMPPDVKGNRGAGVLIAIVATIAFAIVYAGVLALLLAPQLPPSRFVGGLVDGLLAWQSVFAVVAFFVGLVVVVLVVGRAGWWAYVLGGFLVAMLVWVAAFAGAIVDADGFGGLARLRLDDLYSFGFMPTVIAAVLVAREATVWFGAWIGRRGRRIAKANAEAMAEYEAALAEVQAKQL
ncbi:MAG: hypothetical protein D3X82_03310 [Candidatus Leucobacter sulfamidivorax]|nr:hypothetical protein [Candidatus Leucobacter sulfamidivorax]